MRYLAPEREGVKEGKGGREEPPIMDTLKSGQPPYNGHTVHPPACILSIHFYLRRRDDL